MPIGRDDDVADVLAVLRAAASQLITITGPGGVGKTDLALAVAATWAAERGEQVAVAELAPITDARLVLPTIAKALGLPQGEPAELLDRLEAFCTDRRTLLVLDNVEHVIEASAQIGELLTRCPTVQVLATSRAPLRIRAEQERPLAPLALPLASTLDVVAVAPAASLSSTGPAQSRRCSNSPRRIALRSKRSAAGSTACRWPWNSRRRTHACSRRTHCSPASTRRSLDPRARDLPDRQAPCGHARLELRNC